MWLSRQRTYSACTKPSVPMHKQHVQAQACNPALGRREQGSKKFKVTLSLLLGKFKAILGYKRPCLKNKITHTHTKKILLELFSFRLYQCQIPGLWGQGGGSGVKVLEEFRSPEMQDGYGCLPAG